MPAAASIISRAGCSPIRTDTRIHPWWLPGTACPAPARLRLRAAHLIQIKAVGFRFRILEDRFGRPMEHGRDQPLSIETSADPSRGLPGYRHSEITSPKCEVCGYQGPCELLDAVGFVVEGYSPAACKRYIEDYVKTDKVGEFGHFLLPFGQYSDDSQLARELMQSYAKCGKFDPADYAERIAMTFVEKRIIAFGYSTKEAVKRLCQGISWEESGTPPPAAGNLRVVVGCSRIPIGKRKLLGFLLIELINIVVSEDNAEAVFEKNIRII